MKLNEKPQIKFVTIPTVARHWGVSSYTVRQMVKEGRIRAVVLGKRARIHREEIQRVERGL